MSSLSFNPFQQTVASGSFNSTSEGYIAGVALDDPAMRNQLAGGILAATETLPIWGGVGISEAVPGLSTGPADEIGLVITRATTLTAAAANQLHGFSVFNQASAMVQSPQSPVPASASGGVVNYYRLGSLARIALPCAPNLVSLEGGVSTAQVSWDFVNQLLVPYTPGYSANTITGAVWAATSGGQITFTVSTNPTTLVFAGDEILVSGVVNTGGAATTAFNGTWVVVSTSATTIVVSAPAAATLGTYASGGSVAAAVGGALPVKILNINIGNSMVPVYNAATGFVTWNRSGSAAVVLI